MRGSKTIEYDPDFEFDAPKWCDLINDHLSIYDEELQRINYLWFQRKQPGHDKSSYKNKVHSKKNSPVVQFDEEMHAILREVVEGKRKDNVLDNNNYKEGNYTTNNELHSYWRKDDEDCKSIRSTHQNNNNDNNKKTKKCLLPIPSMTTKKGKEERLNWQSAELLLGWEDEEEFLEKSENNMLEQKKEPTKIMKHHTITSPSKKGTIQSTNLLIKKNRLGAPLRVPSPCKVSSKPLSGISQMRDKDKNRCITTTTTSKYEKKRDNDYSPPIRSNRRPSSSSSSSSSISPPTVIVGINTKTSSPIKKTLSRPITNRKQEIRGNHNRNNHYSDYGVSPSPLKTSTRIIRTKKGGNTKKQYSSSYRRQRVVIGGKQEKSNGIILCEKEDEDLQQDHTKWLNTTGTQAIEKIEKSTTIRNGRRRKQQQQLHNNNNNNNNNNNLENKEKNPTSVRTRRREALARRNSAVLSPFTLRLLLGDSSEERDNDHNISTSREKRVEERLAKRIPHTTTTTITKKTTITSTVEGRSKQKRRNEIKQPQVNKQEIINRRDIYDSNSKNDSNIKSLSSINTHPIIKKKGREQNIRRRKSSISRSVVDDKLKEDNSCKQTRALSPVNSVNGVMNVETLMLHSRGAKPKKQQEVPHRPKQQSQPHRTKQIRAVPPERRSRRRRRTISAEVFVAKRPTNDMLRKQNRIGTRRRPENVYTNRNIGRKINNNNKESSGMYSFVSPLDSKTLQEEQTRLLALAKKNKRLGSRSATTVV